MRKFACVLTVLLASVTVVCAGTEVATATSTAPFQLRGATLTTDKGVPSWPIMAGDTIKAGSAPLTITFPGGSTITLEPGSAAKITMSGLVPTFRLESGSAAYSLAATSAVKLMAGDQPITPTDRTGTFSASGKSGGWWTPGRTALVLAGAAAAAGLGLGVASASSGGSSVSSR